MVELRKLAAGAPALAKPLRQFLQTIDDRKRAIENDPRAKATAPPAPDPTAIPGEGGFTGMEAIWNYFFWQTLSINMLDDTAHILRASLTAEPDCMEWHNEPPKSPRTRRCSSAATRTSARTSPASTAPTRSTTARTRRPRSCAPTSGKPASSVGEQRGEGQPEAGPLPGQPDLSKPQIVLPPAVQDLLDSLTPQEQRQLDAERAPAARRAHRRPDHRPAPRLPARAMTRRRGTASIGASPVLIGAATVLVALVAVFIAYNANAGLPFVPTYDLNAELPSGGKLVKGNEVRVGGFRVGVVKDVRPKVTEVNGERRSVAVAELNLDKKIEPLAKDTQFRVRPRSALGLKYIELQPGTSKSTWQSGDTVPVEQSSEPLEFEDLFSTFDRDTRPNIQRATDGFGNAFAGRGQAINRSIEALNPFFKALTPVMRNLSDPRTELDQFFLQMGRASDAGRAGGPHAGAAVHGHGGHVRGHLREPAGAPGHDREGPADDAGLDRLVPGAAAVPGRLHRPVGAAAPGGRGAASLAARDQQRLQGRDSGPARARWS